ncbi:MAG: DUF4384 domain-containing protein [Candidatus Eiseniibacteriota bacterium]
MATTRVTAALVTGLLMMTAAAQAGELVQPAATVVPSAPRDDGTGWVPDDTGALRPDARYQRPLAATVWTDRGRDSIYRIGDPVEVRFRVDDDAYVCVYDIDTEGRVRVLFPAHPDEDGFVPGGLTLAVPDADAGYDLVASGPPGIELVGIVASRLPLDAVHGGHPAGGWYDGGQGYGWREPATWTELDRVDWGAPVDVHPVWSVHGLRVAGDPFVAMRTVNRHLLRSVSDDLDEATGYVAFHIERRFRYPRYLCSDCHGYRHRYDPYHDRCSVFSVEINLGWRYAPRRVHRVWCDWPARYVYVRHARVPHHYRTIRRTWSSLERRELGDRFRRRLDVGWTPPPKSTRVYDKSQPVKSMRGYDWKTDDRRRRGSRAAAGTGSHERAPARIETRRQVPPAKGDVRYRDEGSRPSSRAKSARDTRARSGDSRSKSPATVKSKKRSRGDASSGAKWKSGGGSGGKSRSGTGKSGTTRRSGGSKSRSGGGKSRSGGGKSR